MILIFFEKAMEKELKYEQLVMKEELQREKDDEITLNQELQKEKEKEVIH